jgi:hypothetical protein
MLDKINNHDLVEIELICREELRLLREVRTDLLQGVPRSINREQGEISYTSLQDSQLTLFLRLGCASQIQKLRSILRKIAFEANPNFTTKEQQLINRLLKARASRMPG